MTLRSAWLSEARKQRAKEMPVFCGLAVPWLHPARERSSRRWARRSHRAGDPPDVFFCFPRRPSFPWTFPSSRCTFASQGDSGDRWPAVSSKDLIRNGAFVHTSLGLACPTVQESYFKVLQWLKRYDCAVARKVRWPGSHLLFLAYQHTIWTLRFSCYVDSVDVCPVTPPCRRSLRTNCAERSVSRWTEVWLKVFLPLVRPALLIPKLSWPWEISRILHLFLCM